MNQAPNQLISNFCPEAENGDRPGFSFNGKMLKIGWTTGYAYLSCSIVALNLERSRVTLAPSVHLPRPPSLHLEGTNDASFTRAIPRTPRVARSLFEVEALTGLRHQLHLPVCTCVSRVTSKCDRPTPRARACVFDTRMKRCWPRFYWGKGNRESKIERKKNSVTVTMIVARC